ncbi:MAG TPA: DNA polymerase III subunit delta [Actinomycetota bacterium]|nr:DNA polymerase III subunit delta [Actinomycetota bacterium]
MPDRGAAASPVLVFWGEDAFLLRDAARRHLQGWGLVAREVEASEWTGTELADLATPSLLGEGRALLVAGAHRLPQAAHRELLAYLESPAPDALLVLTVVASGRQPRLLRALQEAGAALREVGLKRQELPRWVLERARLRGIELSPQGAAALVASVGEDPATLDQAVEQLAAAFPGRRVGPEEVGSQFEGLGEQRVWDLCDRAFSGRAKEAMEVLRALLRAREDPLLILGGIASRLRDLIRVASLPEGLPPSEAARAAGVRFDWQVRRYREQAGRYRPADLEALHWHVVEADRALKAGMPGDVVLAALVTAAAGRPEAALDVPVRVSR